MTDLRIEPGEMRELVEMLGAIGEQPGGGILRPVYSPAWAAARDQLARWMAEAGLQVIDVEGIAFSPSKGLHLSEDTRLNYLVAVTWA